MAATRSHRPHARPSRLGRPGLSFVMLGVLLAVLWVAGGASRGDEIGQVIVRAIAWLLLIAAILTADRSAWLRGGPVGWILLASIGLALAQLVPLPPALWQALPGRAAFVEAAQASGQAQPWRPWSIVPGATVNAAASLIVPLAVLVFVTGMTPQERRYLPDVLMALIAGSLFIGLMQIVGAGYDNPFINDSPGQISGIFANRNHFALFLAFGCLLAPVWGLGHGGRVTWRVPVALGLTVLIVLTILATGSRAGLLLAVLALGMAALQVRRDIQKILSGYPRWVSAVLFSGFVAIIAIFVIVSVLADRAQSISRLFADDAGQDMRARGLPTVWAMIREYFPVGSGLGGFDPMFRMHEPLHLLKLTYFNHAHNDLLEIVLDAGLPGLLLLLVSLGWALHAGIRAWRMAAGRHQALDRVGLARIGAAMILLIVVASAFDYPARTPMMMAMLTIAGLWLGGRLDDAPGSALPVGDQHL